MSVCSLARSLLWLVFFATCTVPNARAEQGAVVRFRAPTGHLAFAVQGGHLRAAVCTGNRCDFAAGVEVPVPAELLQAVVEPAFTRIELEDRRVVVRLTLPGGDDRAWEALVTAPLDKKGLPKVAFAGWTGLWFDEVEGERLGQRIEVYAGEGGGSQVIVGSLRSGAELCGRTTLIDPKVLYPKDLELRRIKWMRLTEAERASASTLTAVVDDPAVGTSVSRARVASSATGSPAFLSDGKKKTVWTEDRGGDGRGEFVVFQTPSALPVSHVAWTYGEREDSLPKVFWIATDKSLYRVAPDAATAKPGGSLRVDLPAPEKTSCVAVVLDGAPVSDGRLEVGFAEFEARAAVDDAAIEAMVAKLDDPEADPVSIVETLAALGKASVNALSARYVGMSAAGKSRALNVYDSLPCEDTVRAYVSALDVPDTAQAVVQRLEQCGTVGEKAALRALGKAEGERAQLLAELLARMSPKRAAENLVPLLSKGNRSQRRALRAALSSIAADPDVVPVFTAFLADDQLSEVAAVDLLRALGEHVSTYRAPATRRMNTLLSNEPDYRTRYLLTPPLARLAAADAELLHTLEAYLTRDTEDAVRAQAARWYPSAAPLVRALVQAADDPHVRVREAAIVNLSEHAVEQGRSVLLRRLSSDPWPFIRAASIKGLLALPPSPAIDGALAESAEGDEAPSVRRPALLALGTRNARTHVQVVRERLDDEDEDPYVRAAAAATLGTLCDAASTDQLEGLARTITRLSDDEAIQVVGRAAVTALGRLAPPDLEQRLEMFEGDEVPPWAKQVADAARTHPEPCKR